MLHFVFFILGATIGVLGTYIYFKFNKDLAHFNWQALEARVQTNEEQLAYLSLRIEGEKKLSGTPRTKRSTATKNHDGVLNMLSEGADPETVARATNVPLGQVELLYKLYKRE